MFEKRLSFIVALCICWLLFASKIYAQPHITSVNQHALQIGTTTRLVFTGANFDDQTVINASFPIASQEIVEWQPRRIVIDLALPKTGKLGIHPLRLSNSNGISGPQLFSIDRIPSHPFKRGIHEIDTLPIALIGKLRGSQIIKSEFPGKAGETIHIEIEGRRIGSNIHPILRVYDKQGTQLQWARADRRLAGDARLTFKLPTTGTYTVEMHDSLYRGSNPSFFRLKIGGFQFADLTYPLVVSAQQTTQIRFPSSTFPPNFSTTFPQGIAAIKNAPSFGWQAIPLNHLDFSGNQPSVFVSKQRQITEPEQKQHANSLTPVGSVPVGINGRLTEPGTKDRYVIDVQPGKKLRFELFARRFGSPVDGSLVLKSETGQQLASNDDQSHTTDPMFQYTVGEKIERCILEVTDLTKKYGPDHVYAIKVTDCTTPRFSLHVPDTINISANSQSLLEVVVKRDQYEGPIHISAQNLPAGFSTSGVTIESHLHKALLPIQSHKKSSNPQNVAQHPVFQVIGKAQGQMVVATHSAAMQKWIQKQIGIGVSASPLINVSLAQEPKGTTAFLGGILKRKIKLNRTANLKNDVKIALLTNQGDSKSTATQRDRKKTIRLEKPVSFTGKTDRADVNILIPHTLEEQEYEVAIVAELRSTNQRQGQLRTIVSHEAFQFKRALQISGKREKTYAFTLGTFVSVKGTIERLHGIKQAVTISISGLPDKFKVDPVLIPANQTDFELKIQFPDQVDMKQLLKVTMIAEARDSTGSRLAASEEVKLLFTKQTGQ